MPEPRTDAPSFRRGPRTVALLSAVAVVPLAVGALAVPGSAAAVPRVSALVEISRSAPPPTGAHLVGALPASRRISFGVGLRGRDPAGLARYAAAVSTPGSPLYHRFLTPQQFGSRFGASRAAVRALAAHLRSAGLSVGHATANGLLLPVSGSVTRVDGALHTRLARYRLANGTSGWAASAPAFLPSSVAGTVSSVVGLDSMLAPHSMLERAPTLAQRRAAGRAVPLAHMTGAVAAPQVPAGSPRACSAATDAAVQGGGWTDQQLASAYGLTGLYARGDLAQGQTIAVFELEPYLPSDLARFDRCYFGASHTRQISLVRVDGFNLTGSGSGEALLDLEDLQALAPRAKLIVYAAPNTTFGAIDAYNRIVSQDRANIVTTSWGECETALQTASPQIQQLENTLFEEAAAQGQTVFSAAGDTGSDDCASTPYGSTTPAAPYLSVDDPASQPYVVGVGGTSMLNDANPPTQTVWNDGAKWGGGGGGISNTWASPTWQADSGVPGVSRTAKRQVPDVSAAADEWRGITVFSALFGNPSGGGSSRPRLPGAASDPSPPAGWTTLGGTSSAAPIWAAATAEMAASPLCATLPTTASGRSFGFLAPLLYEVASTPAGYRASFDNVMRGSNDVFGLGLGYRAHRGYNLASGLGSPIVTNAAGTGGLDAHLCGLAAPAPSAPSVSGLAPSAGPTSGGGTVTITGSGFPAGDPSALKVQFGSAAATVTAVPSATSATVTVPAAALAPATANPQGIGGAGAVQVSVSVVTGTGVRTSRPSPAALYDYVATATSGAVVPTVTGVGPVGGKTTGNNRVVVYGTSFSHTTAPTVTFGGVAASGVRVLSSSELSVVVPPESSATKCATGTGFTPATVCQVEVVVSDSSGSSTTLPILPSISGPITFGGDGVVSPTPETEVAPVATEYDYAPPPTVRAVVPNPADASGQTPVAILGSGFSFNTLEWVNFGAASSVLSEQTQILDITPNEIVIDPPAASVSGSAPQRLRGGVSVQTVAGLSHPLAFSYGGLPSVSQLSSFGGPSTGGTKLRVKGSGISSVKIVEFASQVSPGYGASISVAISSRAGNSLTVRTPADLPGPVDVLLCSVTACSRPNPRVDTFVYYSLGHPSVSHIDRRSGPAAGGSVVTLFGQGLNGASGVRFGAALSTRLRTAPGFPDGDPYLLSTLAPPGRAGSTVPVRVVTHAGVSRPVPTATFHYLASAPSPPQTVRAAIRGASARVSWSAPASDGGSAITGYTVIALASGTAPKGGLVSAASHVATIGGLVTGRQYVFRVVASNAAHGRGRWAQAGPVRVAYAANGYRVARADGVVAGFGSLPALGGIGGSPLSSPVVTATDTPDGLGYWLLQANGTVSAFGDAADLGYVHPAAPAVGLAPTPTGKGYWIADASGQVFAFGDAAAHGSLRPGRLPPGTRIVAIEAAPGGTGYWLVASNGALFAFGKAPALPSVTGEAVVAAADASRGAGLYLITRSGSLLGIGSATLHGQPASSPSPVIGLAPTPNGGGYWLLRADGAVLRFGDAQPEGGPAPSPSVHAVAIAAL